MKIKVSKTIDGTQQFEDIEIYPYQVREIVMSFLLQEVDDFHDPMVPHDEYEKAVLKVIEQLRYQVR